ncbi:hypothetical protein MD484_g8242, partial [Candolleomyces efflorescens]
MVNNNIQGHNGHGDKNYPPVDVLKAALEQYARERLSSEEKLARLAAEHQCHISKSTLYGLQQKFGTPSVRKPQEDVATSYVLEKVAQDTNQRNGTGTIGSLLANEGVMIPRDLIRKILAQHAPEGLQNRFPGANRIKRTPLCAPGPGWQYHADGHEKLNAQALGMGGVGLNIYGIKDQWSSFLLHLVVVPNNRLADTIGHVYLDMVDKFNHIPVTMVTDKGSEISYLFAYQTGLRSAYAPDIDVTQSPPVLQLKSVHNTPIEGLWHWFSETCGLNIKEMIISGYQNGIYNPSDPVHQSLFNWIWPQALQLQLDRFAEYWNNHKIRSQKRKPNMSGSTPRHAFIAPDPTCATKCYIEVNKPAIEALRGNIPTCRDDSMRFVDPGFLLLAEEAYDAIAGRWRSLTLSHLPFSTNGWDDLLTTTIRSIMAVAGSPTVQPDTFTQIKKRFPNIFNSLLDLRKATGQDVGSVDLEIGIIRYGQPFDPSYMEDVFADGLRRSLSKSETRNDNDTRSEPVSNTSALGLQKIVMERAEDGRVQRHAEILSMPKVVLEKTMKELLEPPPPPARKKERVSASGAGDRYGVFLGRLFG